MKTLLLLLLSATCFAQDVSFDKSTSFKQIVATLFDGKVQKETGEVAWKPNVAEQFQFRCKPGETLYTVVDTIFENEVFDSKYLILITSTYPKVNGIREVERYSAPVMGLVYITLAEGKYTVSDVFKYVAKTGEWGEAAPVRLLRLEDIYPIIVVEQRWYGSGIAGTDMLFYFYGKNVLSLTAMKTNVYAVEEGNADVAYDYSVEMGVDEPAGMLLFTRTGTVLNAEGASVDAAQVTRYRFDEYNETFVRECE